MTAERTLFTVLEQTAAEYGTKPALYQPTSRAGKDKYDVYTWNQYRDAAREIAAGLNSLGVRKGDIVALYSETRAEFYMADLGVIAAGAIAAALYTSLPMADQVGNLRAFHPKAVIVETPKALAAMQAAFGDQPLQATWILLTGEHEGATTIRKVRELGRDAVAADPGLFDRIRGAYGPHDHAILYLTSGATGEPKMGLVTHDSVISNIDNAPAVLGVGPNDRTV